MADTGEVIEDMVTILHIMEAASTENLILLYEEAMTLFY